MNARQEQMSAAVPEAGSETGDLARAVLALVRRDLRVALRRSGDTLQPLGFFVIVTSLFPLALQPELSLLRDIAPAALWVGALLASLLALDLLFREDAQDGTLEQLALCGQPLASLVLAKTAVHWLLTGLPLVLIAPLAAMALGVQSAALPAVLAALLLGSVTLSLVGAVGAGLPAGGAPPSNAPNPRPKAGFDIATDCLTQRLIVNGVRGSFDAVPRHCLAA